MACVPQSGGFSPHLEYVADEQSAQRSAVDESAKRRFEATMQALFDENGGLRPEHKPKSPKKPGALLNIEGMRPCNGVLCGRVP